MSKTRLCIINKNVPNILANIFKLFADHNLNIENMVNRSRGEYAYTLIDKMMKFDLILLSGLSRQMELLMSVLLLINND